MAKRSVVELIENLGKEAGALQKDILSELIKSKNRLLKLTKKFQVQVPLDNAVAEFVELSEIYIKSVSLVNNARKKGGRKKSDFRYSLAIEVMLEYLSKHYKGALPKAVEYPSGGYIFDATNQKINTFNTKNNTKHPQISPRTADYWLKEFKGM